MKYNLDDLESRHRMAVQAKLEAQSKVREANDALYRASQEADRLGDDRNEASRQVDQLSNSIRTLESNISWYCR